MKLFFGIDPGVGGGVACLDSNGTVVFADRMPDNEHDLFDLFAVGRDADNSGFAVLERVRSSPQMGVVSAFTFGRGYGSVRMAVVASRIPLDEVLPTRWQQALGCLSKGDKNVTKRRAMDLWPGTKVTHANADALLLAEYCRRLHV